MRYPGAIVPFGMVQLSPDTPIQGWDACSGYHYSDTAIAASATRIWPERAAAAWATCC